MGYTYEINQKQYLDSFLNFKKSYLESCMSKKAGKSKKTQVHIWGQAPDKKLINKYGMEKWQKDMVLSTPTVENLVTTEQGNHYFIKLDLGTKGPEQNSHQDLIGDSDFAISRTLGGEFWKRHIQGLDNVELRFENCNKEQIQGFLVGVEVSSYKFKSFVGKKTNLCSLSLFANDKKLTFKEISRSAWLGASVNLSRHLVNMPPSILNPDNYVAVAKKIFTGSKTSKVEVWQRTRLKKEKMGLLLAVGQSSNKSPAMVHIKYTPSTGKSKPIAFVGKGITYDTGGLDIKPSAAMRLMKKDMGGSASVLALSYFAEKIKSKQASDFYLAIAENLVAQESFKSSDVLQSRNGLTVEVHNTDAEGRLALADVLDVAVTSKTRKPKFVIDVATLTGAVKVGLGTELGGLFSNDEDLALKIEEASYSKGDLVWRMPLMQRYRKGLKTPFADILNCGDRFGGAITAALFLESFVGDVPWAHLDIYAWQSGQGEFSEAGGSGQGVQNLSEFL